MDIDYKKAAELLKNCGNAYILIHQSPDGDCIGAGMTIYHLLKSMGKKAKILCSDDIPKRYAFLTEDYEDEDFEPDYIISTDVADINLLGKYKNEYGDKVDLCIDHHISNTHYAKNTLVCPDASAACEVLFEVLMTMDIKPDNKICACIYTGIATDTGCFKYENASSRSHEIVAAIKKYSDINYAQINRRLFDIKSRGQLKMESAVSDKMEYYLDGKCTMITITLELLETLNVDLGEVDGLAGIPLQYEDAEVGVTIKQRDEDSYKISMRSANDVNVSDICASLGGGGHVKAAGCLVHGTLDEVKKIIVDAVEKGMNK